MLPEGSTQHVTDQKMASGELASMVNGPQTGNLRKRQSLRARGIAWGRREPWPTIRGRFVDADQPLKPGHGFATQLLEKSICSAENLKALDADAPLGVPAVKSLAEEMSATNPLIKVTCETCSQRRSNAQYSSDGQVLERDESRI